MNIQELVTHFQGVKETGRNNYMCLCPAHNDTNGSLHIMESEGKILVKCFAGCAFKDIAAAAGLQTRDFMPERPESNNFQGGHYGLTIQDYSLAKKMPLAALASWGVKQDKRASKKGTFFPGLRIPYMDNNGQESAVRWRMKLHKGETQDMRFVWESGGKLCLYGLWKQPMDRKSVILVEGESDCHALWLNGYPALGFPGASNYKPGRDNEILDQYSTIYIHIEKDSGGKSLFNSLAGDGVKPPCRLINKMRFFSLPGYKDPSDAWMGTAENPENFIALISNCLNNAAPADQFRQPLEWGQNTAVNQQGGKGSKTAPEPVKGARNKAEWGLLTQELFSHYQDENGVPTLRFWRNSWYKYDKAYTAIPDADMTNEIISFLQDPEIEETYHIPPTSFGVNNLMAGLRSFRYCGLPSRMEAPSWISTKEPAKNRLVMANGSIDISQASQMQLAREQGQDGWWEIGDDFRDNTPDLLTTNALPYNYDPNAKCTEFHKYLDTVLPGADLQEAAQMMLGLCLVPDTGYNVCFFISGGGGTGKTTFLNVLTALVGEQNICRVALLSLEQRFSTAPLAEKLVNIVGEMQSEDPQGRLRYIEGDFKDTVSGGLITIERKGKDPVPARCIARHVFATNTLPVFFDKSEGIWDRLRIIPFEQRIRYTQTQIKDYDQKVLIPELSGILNFALAGLAKLYTLEQFPEPPLCAEAKQRHRERCDIEGSYLREYYTAVQVDTNNPHLPVPQVEVTAMYQHFRQYLTDCGLAQRSRQTMIAAVERVFGLRPARASHFSGQRVFRGLQCHVNLNSNKQNSF